MNLATYARRNLSRRPGRTIWTIIAVVLAVVIFCAIRTFILAFTGEGISETSDRIATRHKVSITMLLPLKYIEELRQVPGVRAATWANWFGAKDPKERVQFFAGIAVDHNSWFDVQDDMKVPPDQLAVWKQTPNGGIVGDKLAKALGVQVGSRLVISSDIYPGDWEFTVVGIYTATNPAIDRNTLVFRWDYLNNDPRAVYSKEHLGWMVSRIDAAQSAAVATRIDAKFAEQDDQTTTMSERAFALSFLGGFAALVSAFKVVSFVILLIMTLILANTLAMNVRERTHEYGVLRAIGFPPGHIAGFILGESLLVGLLGGLVGIGVVELVINRVLGPAMRENVGGFLQNFFTPGTVLATAFAAAVGLGLLAGAVPAYLASRLKVTDALRRLD